MFKNRKPIDPNNKWSDLHPPLTEEQLAGYREEAGARNEYAPAGYTCDKCADRYVCPLVFDGYNTDGDCLASK